VWYTARRTVVVDYPTNTVMSGGADDLADDDLFRAAVTVGGSLLYDTQIGAETTVPKLEVNPIKVTRVARLIGG
jgi:hypothetical protein